MLSNGIVLTDYKNTSYQKFKKAIDFYKFNIDTKDDGTRIIKNYGTSSDGISYFGRGLLLNGEDQSVSFEVNETVNTIAYFLNGELIIDETQQDIDNFTVDFDGVVQMFIISKSTFNAREKDLLRRYPEKFLYTVANENEDGSKTYNLYSKILSDESVSDIVVFSPMCETNEYAVNLASYAEGVNLAEVTNIYGNTSGDNNTVDNDGNVFTVHNETVTDEIYHPYCRLKNDNSQAGELYKVSVKIEITSGTAYLNKFERGDEDQNNINIDIDSVLTSGRTYEYEFIGNFNSYENITTMFDASTDDYCAFDAVVTMDCVKITAAKQIENYTDSCRDDAKQLTYGVHTHSWKRDLIGIAYDVDFNSLCCDGVGYVDTGFIATGDESFTIEMVIDRRIKHLYEDSLSGEKYLRFGLNSYNNPIYYFDDWLYSYKPDSDIFHWILEYDSNSKQVKSVTDGENEVLNDVDFSCSDTLLLGQTQYHTRSSKTPFRLFKIHTTPVDPVQLYELAKMKGLLDD